MSNRLAIVTTHPIQYNAPLFRMLAQEENMQIKVFYTWGENAVKKFDPGFNKTVEWNIPLLDGYDYSFVRNTAKQPGSHHFRGIDNPTLVKEIQTWRPTAILIYGWAFRSHLQTMRFFHKKVSVLFRGDSTLMDKSSAVKEFLRAAFLRWVYRHVDVALYTGTQNKRYFEKQGLKPHQLVFMPHAVDNERFRRDSDITEETKTAWREKFGIGSDSLVFLYAGKLTANKNTAILLKAFCKAELPGAHLLIAGNGPLEQTLKNEYGKEKSISFVPFQNQAEMPLLLASADVLVMPSQRNETWGLLINEAMACCKPVLVSSACGAAIDLVKPGVNGYIFQNNNLEDLIDKLQRLAKNKNNLQEMGKGSAEIIQNWSYQKDCDAVAAAMQKIQLT